MGGSLAKGSSQILGLLERRVLGGVFDGVAGRSSGDKVEIKSN